jgi:hypothetical protein
MHYLFIATPKLFDWQEAPIEFSSLAGCSILCLCRYGTSFSGSAWLSPRFLIINGKGDVVAEYKAPDKIKAKFSPVYRDMNNDGQLESFWAKTWYEVSLAR